MQIRNATVADLPALLALERSVTLAPHWSEASWQEVLESADRAVLLAEGGEALVGVVVGHDAAGVVELESIAVSKQRAGVGGTLLTALRHWAVGRSAQRIELEVRESNAVAIAFYGGAGFEERGRRPRYYSDPVEGAVLMSAAV